MVLEVAIALIGSALAQGGDKCRGRLARHVLVALSTDEEDRRRVRHVGLDLVARAVILINCVARGALFLRILVRLFCSSSTPQIFPFLFHSSFPFVKLFGSFSVPLLRSSDFCVPIYFVFSVRRFMFRSIGNYLRLSRGVALAQAYFLENRKSAACKSRVLMRAFLENCMNAM